MRRAALMRRVDVNVHNFLTKYQKMYDIILAGSFRHVFHFATPYSIYVNKEF